MPDPNVRNSPHIAPDAACNEISSLLCEKMQLSRLVIYIFVSPLSTDVVFVVACNEISSLLPSSI